MVQRGWLVEILNILDLFAYILVFVVVSMFKAVCPYCSQDYTLDDSLVGKTANCKQCRRLFTLEEDTSSGARTQTLIGGPHHDSGFDLKPPSKKFSMDAGPQKIPDSQAPKRFSPESGMWNVGDTVLGVYEVKALAPDMPYAEGGVGIVHRIYHREWDMDLAVKSPKPHVFQTENGKLNYEKEAQTWIELGLHPNIVTCFLVRRISNIPRLFAEFIGDGSLRDWIRDGRLYDGGPQAALLRILNIATQFAWGLEHAHSQKLLHLDVKPANVMMAGQTAKVTDFGLAQGISELPPPVPSAVKNGSSSDSSALMAAVAAGGMTPGYCSPEQYNAFMFSQKQEYTKIPKITLQSDIWSWAVSVLSMFHGRPPCKKGGQTARKVFEQFLKSEPGDGRPRMPDAVVDLMWQCFEEEPAKRPESMEWVADEMVRIYQDLSGMPFPRSKPVSATWTPETINNRAASMLDLGKPAEAMQLLDQAAAMQPWHPEVTYNQTLLAWRSARMTDLNAVDKLETLVKTRPQSASALYSMGLIQRERGNLQTAADSFENALFKESREDIHRAYLTTEKVVAKSARCLERFPVGQGFEDHVMLDDRGEFILVAKDHDVFELRESATGRIRNTFNPPKPGQKQSKDRVALSDDLAFEFLRDNEGGDLLLKRIGAASATHRFKPVGWNRFFGKKDPTSNGKARLVTDSGIPWVGEIKDTTVDLFDKKSKKKIVDLFGHEDTVTSLAFSQDGRLALTGSLDRTMRLWELPSGRNLRTFTSLGGAVDAVQFGKDGLFALSLLAGGSLRLWDLSIFSGKMTGKTFYRAPLLLSHVASAEEVGRQQSEMNQYCDEIRNAIKTSDFASAVQGIQKASKVSGWESARKNLENEGVWDAISRRTVRRSLSDALCTHTFVGHQDTVSTVAISLDGNLVASAGRDNEIRIWNIAEQKCIKVLQGHFDWVRSVVMTMDAKFIVSGSWDMSVRVWNIGNGQCVRKFDEKIKSLTKIALNPQGRTVAIANGQGAVLLWDVLTDDITDRFFGHDGSVNTVRFNRNGRYLVTGGDDCAVAVWKIGRDEPIRKIRVHKAPVASAVLSTDLSRLLSADRDGRIIVWNLHEDKLEFDLQGHFGDVNALETLADDRFFLSASKDMKVRLEGIQDRSMQRVIEGHSSPIFALDLDVSGRRFVTGCEDAVVRVWDLYWNYEFPGWSGMTSQAEETLKMLLSLYSPDPDAKEKPVVDATIIKRIMLEMEYRGFGYILPDQIKLAVQHLLDSWTGTQILRAE